MSRYRIDTVFAEGAQSRLYLAHDFITNKKCVLKTGDRIREEALLALELNHPYVVKPFDLGILPEIGPYASYPEFANPSLLQWASAPKGDLRRIALQISEFLALLHHRGWLYNDFKPEHFLISDQEIHVLDLGLCKKIHDTSTTFSGTFPFIAPERLAGRPCDARSDIFGMGMMLLSVLTPEEKWDYEPSLALLQELPNRASKLKPFWRTLISGTIAFEPSQRIESAEELYHRLLPASSRKHFLFFPIRNHLEIDDSSTENRIVIFRSGSQINLREIENQVIRNHWQKGLEAIVFDFREKELEECFDALHQHLLGKSSVEFFACIQSLQRTRSKSELLLVFKGCEFLTASKRALFAYAISELDRSTFRIMILTSKTFRDLPEEISQQVDVPLMSAKDIDRILDLILPSNKRNSDHIRSHLSGNYSIPEQIVDEIRQRMIATDFSIWPAAAKEYYVPATLTGLNLEQLNILCCFAVCGTSLTSKTITCALNLEPEKCVELLEELQKGGYVEHQRNEYFLTVSEKEVLNHTASEQIQKISKSLLQRMRGRQEISFMLACFANEERIAAALALRIARKYSSQRKREAMYEWLWKAFSHDGKIPKNLLFRLTRFNLLRGNMKRSRKLLQQLKKRFGRSYRFYSLVLELYHRQYRLHGAENIARSVMNRSKQRGHLVAFDYFSVLLGSFLIKQNRFSDGEAILISLREKYSSAHHYSSIKPLADHYLGMSYFYRMCLPECIEASTFATKAAHPLRPVSIMNLGIFLTKAGRESEGEAYLRESITLLKKRNDWGNLSCAYNNLGVTLKQRGALFESKEAYYRSMQMSLACQHRLLQVCTNANIGILCQLQGRTHEAIRFLERAVIYAKRLHLDGYLASIYNYLGQQYAIQGNVKAATKYLFNALKVLKHLNFQYYVFFSYEYLGLCYLLSGDFKKAKRYLEIAINITLESNQGQDNKRVALYLALLFGEAGQLKKMRLCIENQNLTEEDTFEKGLYYYAKASWFMLTNQTEHSGCREALQEAQRLFHSTPSLFWLGKLHKLKAEYYLRTDHFEKAQLSLQEAHDIFSKIGAKKELKDLSKGMLKMKNSDELVNRMAEKLPYKILLMIKDVLGERDPNKMIEEILHTTLQFTDMQRAVLILDEDPPRIFKSASIEDSAVQEIREISHSAMNSAIESRKSFVCLDVASDRALRSRPSIIGNRILSVLCFPLRAEDQLLGVLYLDSREGVETISQSETSLLEIFASIISVVLLNLLALENSVKENKQLRRSIASSDQFPELIGNSEEVLEVRNKVYMLLNHELPVLISGETGTGKELVARVLHSWSKRKELPFVAINCSAISKPLLENELFGHEKGSFTGAHKMKRGLFEEAENGTLFLDEIGDMPLSLQAKLLRVLQEKEFRRIGGNTLHHSRARIILATNHDLLKMVKEGRFREDLYYRICAVQIHLPALRKRTRDILLLARQFLKSALIGTEKHIHGFSPQAQELMIGYPWPGNVRQLKNEIERIAALTEKDWIETEDFSPEIQNGIDPEQLLKTHSERTLKEIEREIIQKRLEEHNWNIVRTAATLGLTRHGLYSKIRLYKIERRSKPESKAPARSTGDQLRRPTRSVKRG